MSWGELEAVQTLVIAGCSALLALVLAVLLRAGRVAGRRHLEGWSRRARGLGFVWADGVDPRASMRRVVDGVEVMVTSFEEPVVVEDRTTKEKRGLVRSFAPSRWADGAVVAPDRVSLAPAGMVELRLAGWSPFRIFARNPAEAETWMPPMTRAALGGLGLVQSLTIQEGIVSLFLSAPPGSPAGAAAATQLVADVHRGVPSAGVPAPLVPADTSAPHRPLLLLLGFLGAMLCGFFGPYVAPVTEQLSPLVCSDRGQAEVVLVRVPGPRTSRAAHFDEIVRCRRGETNHLSTLSLWVVWSTAGFIIVHLGLTAFLRLTRPTAGDP